ncbi:translation machinery-associated protein 20 [Sorochytrium milnesiophthora]
MFKKFVPKDDITSQSQIKSSVQRGIRAKIIEECPDIEQYIDDLLPKKQPVVLVKCREHLQLLAVNNKPLFFSHYDGPWMPTLRLLHQYPFMMKRLQVDRGAIKFVLSGAHIMCPGLTSPGAKMDAELPAEAPCAIFAEGKEHPMCIGWTKMSTADIKKINKGVGIDNVHYLGDPLWKLEELP